MKWFARSLIVAGLIAACVYLRPQRALSPDLSNESPNLVVQSTTAARPSDPVSIQSVAQRAQRLERMEGQLRELQLVREKMPESRRKIRNLTQPVWTSLMQTNWPRYQQLLEKARSSPKGVTLCTLGDAEGYMPCVVCDHRSGQCRDCGGTGRLKLEICPTCGGDGKCFACLGHGRMLCPFCNDGMIDVSYPAPAASLPTGFE